MTPCRGMRGQAVAKVEKRTTPWWVKPLVAGALLSLVALSIAFFGVPSTLSIGGGIALIVFGLLWPGLWVASLLPPGKVPFIRPQKSPEPATKMRPTITVLAPARNEEPVAERLVAQFLDQDYDAWRLVVIANNCTDDTAEVARRAAGGDPRIEVVEATFENGVKADALNLALKSVETDVVLELDSDNQVPPDLLSKIAAAFSDPSVMAVQTQIRAYNAKDSLLAALQDLEFLIYSEVWNRGRAALGLGSSIGGTGFAARTSVLQALGGWTRDLVEDFEMHTRLVVHGIKVVYLPWAWVYDEKPITWSALVKQRKRWVRGHLQIAARRGPTTERLGAVDQFYLYSPLFVALAMSLFAMGYVSVAAPAIVPGYMYFSPWFWLVSLGLMTAALSTTVVRSRDLHLLPLIPVYLLFFTFHWMIVFCFAVFPVSWDASKTVHGVEAEAGVLSWLGIDGKESARLVAGLVLLASLWMMPLFKGLSVAPSPIEAPLLQAGRSVAVAYAGAAQAQGIADGAVQGRVRDSAGAPIQGATVTLTVNGVTYNARTLSSGDFLFPVVPAGSCHIQVRKDGYDTASTTFQMPAQGGVWVDVMLSAGGGGVVVVPIPY